MTTLHILNIVGCLKINLILRHPFINYSTTILLKFFLPLLIIIPSSVTCSSVSTKFISVTSHHLHKDHPALLIFSPHSLMEVFHT